MPFLRYAQPAWYGAVASVEGSGTTAQPIGLGYDCFNVNDGGVGPDGATAYGKVTSGPNQYTHMVALREDAVSFAFNRGLKALSENTDHLDDLVNADRIQLTAALVSIGR